MNPLFTQNSHVILHGQVLSGIARQAKTLHVAGGLVWITIEGMPDDHWLRNGDTLAIPSGRLVVVEGEKYTSRIEIRPAKIRQARTDAILPEMSA